MKKKSKRKLRVNKRNPVARAVRTPRFRSRVELDRKKESKSTGKYLDEE
jgi:stalled ribosome alternative rescue factor ArfA|tara:strand:- start:1523 stop:1669 length:147 start_codon:yes stop_codon:yes gene_type:complete